MTDKTVMVSHRKKASGHWLYLGKFDAATAKQVEKRLLARGRKVLLTPRQK